MTTPKKMKPVADALAEAIEFAVTKDIQAAKAEMKKYIDTSLEKLLPAAISAGLASAFQAAQTANVPPAPKKKAAPNKKPAKNPYTGNEDPPQEGAPVSEMPETHKKPLAPVPPVSTSGRPPSPAGQPGQPPSPAGQPGQPPTPADFGGVTVEDL